LALLYLSSSELYWVCVHQSNVQLISLESFQWLNKTSTNLSLGQDRLVGSDFLLDTGQGSLVFSDVTAGLGFLVSAVGLQFRQLEEDKMDK
jgi:hypothetical protein